MRRFGKLGRLTIGTAAAVVLTGVSAGSALAGPVTSRAPDRPEATVTSKIASGYAAVPKTGGAKAFTHVQDSFTVPGLNCASFPNGTAQMRAGLFSALNVVQDGLNETCTDGVASYTTWHQYYPIAPIDDFSPKPGDTLNSSVTYSTTTSTYTLSMQDLTSGQAFSISQECINTCVNTSAAVTAGSPSGIAPANFTAVNFHVIIVTDTAGTSGGLANPNWNTDTYIQSGTPHTVAGKLLTSSPPPESAFQDTWSAS
jgi:hypothetical protein